MGFASWLALLFFTCPFPEEEKLVFSLSVPFQEITLIHEGCLNVLLILDMCLSDFQNKNYRKH